jgi:hypothetical protein
MTGRFSAACLVAGVAWLAPMSAAQTVAQSSTAAPYVVPRTSFGAPSIEGTWGANFIFTLEASEGTPLTLPENEAQALANTRANQIAKIFDEQLDPEIPVNIKNTDGLPIVRGERRTRAVVVPADGKLPYTPEALKEVKGAGSPAKYDNHEERPNWERCITNVGLPPVTFTRASNLRRIVQTPTHVVLHTEYGDEARIIPFADKHRLEVLHTVLGDSIARWEGDTLVIETVSLPDRDRKRAFSNNMMVPGDAKVIERLTRVSDDELLYQFTVEDPKTYSAPWLAEYSVFRTEQPMFEHACHEGNYSIRNILQGGRVADAKAKAKAHR